MKFVYPEMIVGYKPSDIPQDVHETLIRTMNAVNKLGEDYPSPMAAKRGWRSKEDNAKAGGVDTSPHLTGHAFDIVDPGQKLALWCCKNPAKLEACGLFMEDPAMTVGINMPWCHLQIREAKSGTIFRPFPYTQKQEDESLAWWKAHNLKRPF